MTPLCEAPKNELKAVPVFGFVTARVTQEVTDTADIASGAIGTRTQQMAEPNHFEDLGRRWLSRQATQQQARGHFSQIK